MFKVNKPELVTKLTKGMFGKTKKGEVYLHPIEALFLNETRNLEFGEEPLNAVIKSRLIYDYIVYRDLRIRGLKIRIGDFSFEGKYTPVRIYKNTSTFKIKEKFEGSLADPFVIVKNKKAKKLYEKHWFGQWGLYKKSIGNALYLDKYESRFLKEEGILNASLPKLNKREEQLYRVFKIWRKKGFVLKSGLKFGGDFRIYPHGTRPGNVRHSKHIMQVFPSKTITAGEWSKSVRVVHGVRKTYILCMERLKPKESRPEFAVIGRDGKFAYYVKVYGEDEKINARELLSNLLFSQAKKAKLLISIVDRETSVIYYLAKRIILPDDEHIYFEIDWIQP